MFSASPNLAPLLPGVGLCSLVAALAYPLHAAEVGFGGRAWLEALAFAILPGLGVDIQVVAKAGLPMTAAVALSLIALGLISLALIHLIGVASGEVGLQRSH